MKSARAQKLSLSKQTIRSLSSKKLAQVGGGYIEISSEDASCQTCYGMQSCHTQC